MLFFKGKLDMVLNKFARIYSLIFVSFIFTFVSIDLHSNVKLEEDEIVSENSDDEVTDEDAVPENLEECMMQAESMKDAKNCEKDFMQTIEEFVDEEELVLVDGFLKIYTNEDGSAYFLKLDEEDLNSEFLYFSYIMNAPQGSPLTGGLPSNGKVLEFRNFKKDKIGLYQINTSYITGDPENNIAKSSITNITEAFVEVFKPSARTDNSFRVTVSVST